MLNYKPSRLQLYEKGPVNIFYVNIFFNCYFFVSEKTKQPPEMFCEKKYSQKFCKFHRKTPMLEALLIKLQVFKSIYFEEHL